MDDTYVKTAKLFKEIAIITGALAVSDVNLRHCRLCEGTYPLSWSTDGKCPFCAFDTTDRSLLVFETYTDVDYPEASDEFYDSHLTRFAISQNNLSDVLRDTDWGYAEFMQTWTWDMAEVVYEIALIQGKLAHSTTIARNGYL